MAHTLSDRLATAIAEMIATRGWGEGTRLPERLLAEELRVSRSPIRGALRILEERGVVGADAGSGYSVRLSGRGEPALDGRRDPDDEEAYAAVAADRVAGRLPDRVYESDLVRRYGLSRAQVAKLLSRAAGEGWVERLPGNGWEFLPALTSAHAYEQSFRFRIITEPAGILEPGFTLNAPALLACRDQQVELLAGGVHRATKADLFEINSHLHGVIADCSGNAFIVDSLRRITRLRRLMEYGNDVDRDAHAAFCREHIVIIDLLIEGRLQQAADALRLHLGLVSRRKLRIPLG